jgi:D-3-phosphoglycerate dehydrogenase
MTDKHTVFFTNDWVSDITIKWLDELNGPAIKIVKPLERNTLPSTIYPKDEWPELFGNTELIVVSTVTGCTREMMEYAPKLKAVMAPFIGVETIDIDAATELGILVAHSATPENFLGIAEATIMLMGALSLDLHFKETNLRNNDPHPGQLKARMIRGKKIGLVGMGRIARAVVDRLAGWECEIQYYDPYVPQGEAPVGINSVDLDTLMSTSDIVSLHVTVTDESRHMIGERELRLMKSSAYLINTARGAALDEAAISLVLEEEAIAGAALDAFEVEPLPENSPLRRLKNVILTPHMVGGTQEHMASLPIAMRENVSRILRNEVPLYVKNPEVLPKWQERLKKSG